MRYSWMHPHHISRRPWPARLALGVLGLVLTLVGIIGWLVPVIPGFPLIFIGLPLMFGIHPRSAALYKKAYEALRRRGHALYARIKKRGPPPA